MFMPIFAAMGGVVWCGLLIVVLLVHGLARALGGSVETICVGLAAISIVWHMRRTWTDLIRATLGRETAGGSGRDVGMSRAIETCLFIFLIWAADHAGSKFLHWFNPPGHHVEIVVPPGGSIAPPAVPQH